MREFQERRRLKKLLHSRYIIALLVLVCVFLVNAVWNVYWKYDRSRAAAGKVETDLRTLESKYQMLTQSITDLSTEAGKEKEVRERFGVVREGEKLIVLIDEESADQVAGSAGSKNLVSRLWRWWNSFFDSFRRD